MDDFSMLTLGEIIEQCDAINDKAKVVYFDFGFAVPTSIDSWRGIYAHLALGFTFGGEEMRLPQFIDLLKGAVGRTFEGYKGDDFTMTKDTPVWVANYGNSGNTAIINILDKGYQVVIETAYREV